jgi:biopolymer transport protein TolR
MSIIMGPSRGSARRRHQQADMNLTPLIDVMVVLLIIFMISAPLMTVTVPVDLPNIGAGTTAEGDDPLVITIDKKNDIYLQETKLSMNELIPKLQAVTKEKPNQRIYIRADQSLNYGTIMKIMSQMTASGFTKVALVAETGN